MAETVFTTALAKHWSNLSDGSIFFPSFASVYLTFYFGAISPFHKHGLIPRCPNATPREAPRGYSFRSRDKWPLTLRLEETETTCSHVSQ